jgi:hypothetical protein
MAVRKTVSACREEQRRVLEEALAAYERKGIIPAIERTTKELAELG